MEQWRRPRWLGARLAHREGVIAADYAPDGKTLAVVRRANRKVELDTRWGVIFIPPPVTWITCVFLPLASKSHLWTSGVRRRPGLVSEVDEAGNRKQLTQEFESVQGWPGRGRHGNLVHRLLFVYGSAAVWREPLGKAAANPDDATRDALSGYCARAARASFQRAATDEHNGIDPQPGKNGVAGMVQRFRARGYLPERERRLCLLSGEGQRPLYWWFRKLDGSAPVALGPGSQPRFHRMERQLRHHF